ncbi:MAG: hypothetical protein A2W80_16770 [Candidatus Riflebacteria bacterium GWC2_50_8]|nr:MAG: hypothetical protein A2W80_16770 [Candidatus Riflebacteria bacterium GWC2_50_8]
MKSKILLLTILLIIGSASLVCGESLFATIDYRTCLVLHPEMKDFDFVSHRFTRPQLKRNEIKVMEAVYERMTAQQKVLAPKIDALLAKQSKIQETISKTRLNWTLEGTKLAQLKISKDEIAKRLDETQTRDQKKLDKLQDEFSEIDKEIVNLQDSIWKEVFLSRAETVEKLEIIVAELDATIKEIAGQLKVACVIDDTLSAPEAPTEVQQNIPENTPLWSNTAYQIILKSPLPEPNTFTIANHWAPSLMKTIENLSFQHLAHRKDVGSLAATVRPAKLFIAGGQDITEQVCRALFEKYKFNSYLIDSLIKGIKMFRER